MTLALHCLASLAAITWLVTAGPALAQLPTTQLGSVFPPGGQQGQTVEVSIAGSTLDGVDRLQFSHAGITATPKMAEPGPHDKALGIAAPQPIENTFLVTIKADVPPGAYDVYAFGKYGVSNPRAFVVSDRQQVLETEPNGTPDEAGEPLRNVIINGRVDSGADLDVFKITAKAGERIIVECLAERIDSRMDPILAVYDTAGRELASSRNSRRGDPLLDFTAPAAADYFVRVHDALYRGSHEFYYQLVATTGPYVDYVFPPAGQAGKPGTYTVYGRNLPGGQPAGVEIDGRPLEKVQANITLPAASNLPPLACALEPDEAVLPAVNYRFQGSNTVRIGLATAPVSIEQEPNDQPDQAHKLTLPCEIAGQFFPQGDRDWFELTAKAGEVYNVEIISQRMGLPTDVSLVLLQLVEETVPAEPVAEGQTPAEPTTRIVEKLIASVDDSGTSGGAHVNDRSDDPQYVFQVPADGTYRLLLRDAYSSLDEDPRRLYRLVIRPLTPDFQLAAAPNTGATGLSLKRGENAGIRLAAYRQDGFDGEITVTVTGLPAGVTATPVTLGPDQTGAELVLNAAGNAADAITQLQIVGKAQVAGKEVTRTAATGTIVWPNVDMAMMNQNQFYALPSRVSQNMTLSVSAGQTGPFAVVAGEGKVYEQPRAGKLEIPFTLVKSGDFNIKVDCSAVDLPPNVDLPNFSINPGTASGKFALNLKNNSPVGTYTFHVRGVAQNYKYKHNPEAAAAAEERQKELAKIAQDTAAAAKTATDAKAAADKVLADAQTAVNTATAAKQKADEDLAKAEAAAKEAAAAKVVADKAAVDSAAALKKAETEAANKQDEASKQALAAAQAAAKTATDAKTAADKLAADTTEAAKKAAEAVTAAAKTLTDTEAAHKKATEDQAVAAKAAEEAQALSQAAAQAKQAQDQRTNQLKQIANERNVNLSAPSTPIVVKITPGPVALAVKPLAGKQNTKLMLPISITRLYSYGDKVTITARLPSGVGNIDIPNIDIAGGQNQGTMEVYLREQAPVGEHELTISALATLNGQQVTVQETIPLTVQMADPPAETK